MPKGIPLYESQTTLTTCVECAEQATCSCALCRTPLCKRHQHLTQREEMGNPAAVMLCSVCAVLKVGNSLDELYTYIAWYNPGWALA